MQPFDEISSTYQQNVLQCVAVLRLHKDGSVMLCDNGQQFAHNKNNNNNNNNSNASKRPFSNEL